MEGDSVTLNTDVETNHEDRIMWYFNDSRIAQIIGNHSKICTDVECPERFRDRLKLDHVTASLTITDINTTDSGPYHLQINNRNHEKMFNVAVHDAPAADRDEIKSVKEGESVTLDPGVINNPNHLIMWLFNDVCIAEINGDPSKTCTDVQCKDADGSFRDRLEVNQTGSLTIMNTRTTDSGVYKLQIISNNVREMICNVTVHDVPAPERDEMKRKSVKEEESVTLDPGVIKKPNDSMMWYFNDNPITEITGDQSKICIDDQCKERFRDRLKLDHQTGSLTITNTRTTDSGVYHLQIKSNSSIHHCHLSISSIRRFSVTVIDSSLSLGAVAGISVGVAVVILLVAAVVTAGVICYRRRIYAPAEQNASITHNISLILNITKI